MMKEMSTLKRLNYGGLIALGCILIACEDPEAPLYPEPMLRMNVDREARETQEGAGAMTSNGGTSEGGMGLGGELGGMGGGIGREGGIQGGEMSGGEVVSGSTIPVGGSTTGGEGGGMSGGDGSGGSTGGDPLWGDDSCSDILVCFNACPEADQNCFDLCMDQGSAEGISALNALIDCDLRSGCASMETCLVTFCAPELERCDLGGALSGGSEGGEPAGSEGGALNGGELAGGSDPIIGENLSCNEIINCFGQCPDDDQSCLDACYDAGTYSAQYALDDIYLCADIFSCSDANCLEIFCDYELSVCAEDGQGGASSGGGCISDVYEPNNSSLTATSSSISRMIDNSESLTLCGSDEDYFAFELCAGGTLTATVTFDSFTADIDLDLFLEGLDEPEEISNTWFDVETVSYNNIGTEAQVLLLRVFVFMNDNSLNGITYAVDFSVSGCP